MRSYTNVLWILIPISPDDLRSIEQEISKLYNFLSNLLCYTHVTMLFQKQQGVISCIKTNFFSLDLSQQKFTQIFFTPTHISPEIFRWIEHEYFWVIYLVCIEQPFATYRLQSFIKTARYHQLLHRTQWIFGTSWFRTKIYTNVLHTSLRLHTLALKIWGKLIKKSPCCLVFHQTTLPQLGYNTVSYTNASQTFSSTTKTELGVCLTTQDSTSAWKKIRLHGWFLAKSSWG